MNGYEPIGDGRIGAAIDVASGHAMLITGEPWQRILRERRDGAYWSHALRGGNRLRVEYVRSRTGGDGGYLIPPSVAREMGLIP